MICTKIKINLKYSCNTIVSLHPCSTSRNLYYYRTQKHALQSCNSSQTLHNPELRLKIMKPKCCTLKLMIVVLKCDLVYEYIFQKPTQLNL